MTIKVDITANTNNERDRLFNMLEECMENFLYSVDEDYEYTLEVNEL